uniref:Uncharacterized protein n=1 Tax=Cacopsylla melanoneura TaxID=428564 RepID=A0A8D8X5W3_9HEMI
MFSRIIQLLVPTAFYLITTQCKLSDGVESSKHVHWVDLNMAGDEWTGIKDLIGKACDHCVDLATIVKGRQGAKALRKECQFDSTVKYPNGSLHKLCWIRQKELLDLGYKRTVYEVQFWTESPTVSQVRWANN